MPLSNAVAGDDTAIDSLWDGAQEPEHESHALPALPLLFILPAQASVRWVQTPVSPHAMPPLPHAGIRGPPAA